MYLCALTVRVLSKELSSQKDAQNHFSLSSHSSQSFLSFAREEVSFMSLHKTATEKLVVTLRRGLAGKRDTIKLTCIALGLRKPRASRVVPNTSTTRGQIEKIKHLVKVETETAFLKRLERKEKKFSLRPEIVVEH